MIKAKISGLEYELNIENYTATIIGSDNFLFDIIIPKTVFYQSQYYTILNIGKLSFAYHKTINNVTFSADSCLQIIDDEAFTHSSIKSIFIPSSVTKIGKKVFRNCQSLDEVSIQSDSNLTIIDEEAFFYCSISHFYLPKFVKKIGKNSFDSCSNLKTFTIPEDSELQTIEKEAFAWTPIESLYFPANLNEFGEECFCSTTNLEKVNISPQNKNLTYLDFERMIVIGKSDPSKSAFDVLIFVSRSYIQMIIPNTIRIINTSAFSGCEYLEYVFFEKESNLISIEEGAFSHSTLLGIKIPSSVISIKKNAFARCESMQIVYFDEGSQLKFIGNHAFAFTNIIRFNFPENIREFTKGSFYSMHYLTEIILNPKNKNLSYLDSSFIIAKSDPNNDEFDKIIIARRDIKKVIIPSFIKCICSNAFANCNQLEIVEFMNDSKLETIESYAFFDTSIKKIIIPKHVKFIHKNAFDGCSNLESVEFDKDSELIKIGKFAFDCQSLKKLNLPSNVEVIKQGNVSSYQQLKKVSSSPNNKIINKNLLIGKKSLKNDSFDFLISSIDDFYEITIPSYVKYISYFAFISHEKLKIVNFEKNSQLNSIGVAAFRLSSIESIVLPNSLKIVDRSAFANCYELRALEFLSDEISIDSLCFEKSDDIVAISFPNAKKVRICFDAFDDKKNSFSLFLLPHTELTLFSSEYD